MIEKDKILSLLDDLDKFRRDHQDSLYYPSDWCMRCMEAIVARAGGFESRSEWTDLLMADTETLYSKDVTTINHIFNG